MYLWLSLYSGLEEIYWAPKSAVHWGFPGLLEVDIRPPAPLALSQTDILAISEHFFASNEEETALVMPPPITEIHDKKIVI